MRVLHFPLILASVAMLVLAVPKTVRADCPGPPNGIQANPNRPTVADPADITQHGVLEVEFGFEHVDAPSDQHQKNLGGLLKFAATCNLEIRWETDPLLIQGPPQSQTGIGDNWLGFQYRFYRQSRHRPALAFAYALKFPSANSQKNLGSGRYDHHFKFLASKDVYGIHLDFNASVFQLGSPDGGAYDHNAEFNLAFSHPIYRNLQFTGEFYGDTRLNAQNQAYASGLWAITYAFTPRLVVDSGMDHGLNSGSPHNRRIFFGFTYSIADLYGRGRKAPALERQTAGSPANSL